MKLLSRAQTWEGPVVFVEGHAKAGDHITVKIGNGSYKYRIKYIIPEETETETVLGSEIRPGDELFVCDEWRTVLSHWLHKQSPYNKISVSQQGTKVPLSVKLDLSQPYQRLTRKSVMSLTLIACDGLVKSIQAKLIDYATLNDAPNRVEILPSVYVDKEPVMSALRADIRAQYAKLGEQLKKL